RLGRRRRRVLEIACGTGRAAIPIAQAGHAVVGVDYDAAVLSIARRKRDGVGLTERQLRLVRADALRLDLGEQFDAVAVFFNTFLNFVTLAEQDAVLARAVAHLKPGGRLWLDVFQPDHRMLAEPVQRDLDPVQFYVPALDRTVFRTTDVERDDDLPQVQRLTFNYQWFDGDGQAHHETSAFRLTYIFPRELHLLLARHGLRVEHLWGDYDGSELRPESPRMIAAARRTKSS
ncbi:MAG TPA: class I SAM-dependent methyltransferase, partial [Tepidisphaeraceae bacterium]|nr:class I SAM-dependent methyltransferase [Tepidisphaeraceae bacterium]